MSLRSREASPEEHDEYLMMTWKRWGVNCWTVEASLNKRWETEIVKQHKAKEDGNFVYFGVLFFMPLYWSWGDCGCLYRQHIFVSVIFVKSQTPWGTFLWFTWTPEWTEFVVESCEGHSDLTTFLICFAIQRQGNYYLCHPSMWKYQEITLIGDVCSSLCRFGVFLYFIQYWTTFCFWWFGSCNQIKEQHGEINIINSKVVISQI